MTEIEDEKKIFRSEARSTRAAKRFASHVFNSQRTASGINARNQAKNVCSWFFVPNKENSI